MSKKTLADMKELNDLILMQSLLGVNYVLGRSYGSMKELNELILMHPSVGVKYVLGWSLCCRAEFRAVSYWFANRCSL